MIAVKKFKRQPLPRQLGALAATLGRVAFCARLAHPTETLYPLFTESIQVIEWIAPDAPPDIAAELIDMQVLLGLWRKSWPVAQAHSPQPVLLALQVKKWSDQVLDYSGLLDA